MLERPSSHLSNLHKVSKRSVDENGYLVPCEKEQSVIRLMKILRKKGNSYKKYFWKGNKGNS